MGYGESGDYGVGLGRQLLHGHCGRRAVVSERGATLLGANKSTRFQILNEIKEIEGTANFSYRGKTLKQVREMAQIPDLSWPIQRAVRRPHGGARPVHQKSTSQEGTRRART